MDTRQKPANLAVTGKHHVCALVTRHRAPTEEHNSAVSTCVAAPALQIEPGCTYDFGFGTLTLDEDPQLPLPRIIVRGRNKAMDDAGLIKLLDTFGAMLARGTPFTMVYDVRTCSLPSSKQIKIGQKWGQSHAKRLNA